MWLPQARGSQARGVRPGLEPKTDRLADTWRTGVTAQLVPKHHMGGSFDLSRRYRPDMTVRAEGVGYAIENLGCGGMAFA